MLSMRVTYLDLKFTQSSIPKRKMTAMIERFFLRAFPYGFLIAPFSFVFGFLVMGALLLWLRDTLLLPFGVSMIAFALFLFPRAYRATREIWRSISENGHS